MSAIPISSPYHLYHLIFLGRIYYVGITRNPDKRFASHWSSGVKMRRRTPVAIFIRDCLRVGMRPDLKVVRRFDATEAEAREVERDEISRLRRSDEPLLNVQSMRPDMFSVVTVDASGRECYQKKSEDDFNECDYRIVIERCRQRKQKWARRERKLLKNAAARFPKNFVDVESCKSDAVRSGERIARLKGEVARLQSLVQILSDELIAHANAS